MSHVLSLIVRRFYVCLIFDNARVVFTCDYAFALFQPAIIIVLCCVSIFDDQLSPHKRGGGNEKWVTPRSWSDLQCMELDRPTATG